MQKKLAPEIRAVDKQNLDRLIGIAMLDDAVYNRLINERDTALFDEFNLSEGTQEWIRAIRATSLSELAHAIVSRD